MRSPEIDIHELADAIKSGTLILNNYPKSAIPHAGDEDAEPDYGNPWSFEIRNIPVQGSRIWNHGKKVTPAQLIAALAHMAETEILLLAEELKGRTYSQQIVINEFNCALRRGVKVWIISEQNPEAPRTFIKQLSHHCNFNIRQSKFPNITDNITRIHNDNFLVVDREFVRYEENITKNSAVGLRSEKAALKLRSDFCKTWRRSTSLSGALPNTINITQEHVTETSEEDNVNYSIYSSEELPGISIPYFCNAHQRPPLDAITSIISTSIDDTYGLIGTSYSGREENGKIVLHLERPGQIVEPD